MRGIFTPQGNRLIASLNLNGRLLSLERICVAADAIEMKIRTTGTHSDIIRACHHKQTPSQNFRIDINYTIPAPKVS
jgi:hypothetical protein